MDLIYAEATPPGRGGISVIRLSGAGARAALERLVGDLPQARHCYFRDVKDADEVVDQALAVWFEEGLSFTGEEVAEVHLHGAPVIAKRVTYLLEQEGARQAEAGEFTRRAFMSGRMDLAEVEGLGDLLEAETEYQRQLAVRSAGGELSRKAERWRELLIRAGAMVEVSVDFADEEVPDEVPDEVFELLGTLREELREQISGFGAAERIRNGFEIAIIGPPNAGKSSLINRIARRDVALVSQVAGTTRDVIEVRLDLKGLSVNLLDTAGIRETTDEVEQMGVDLARKRALAADLRLHLSEHGEIDESMRRDGDFVVQSKADLNEAVGEHSVSSKSGAGIDKLLDNIFEVLSQRVVGAGIVSHERQVRALTEAYESLCDIEGLPPEFLAESIRRTGSSLDKLLGRIGAEEYLSVIFSSFCIGK